MKTWVVRYKLEKSGKYFFRNVNTVYQHEANAIFDAEMPNVIRCGSAKISS